MILYKVSSTLKTAIDYLDIGHKKVKSIISVWRMLKDGTIEEKTTTLPGDIHHSILWTNINNTIAEGRCDFGKKTCSIAYTNEGMQMKSWIKHLLKEKFGDNIQFFDFPYLMGK